MAAATALLPPLRHRFNRPFCSSISPNVGSSAGGKRRRREELVRVDLPEKVSESKVLVIGGTGKVGGSTALALSRFCPSLRLFIAGRNRWEKGTSVVSTIGENAEFVEVDIDDMDGLLTTLEGMDLVVHCAGPFQQKDHCNVLDAAIKAKTSYMDVCDDMDYSWRTKSFHEKAMIAGIPAMTSCGIYPGVSNVMAAELVRLARDEEAEPERLRFSYYTAGSGGAGPTILATSFLLLGEDVSAYNKGELVKLKPYSGMMNVDFGKAIRKKDVYLLNLPEVRSAHEILGVPTVSARFGTAPFFWNLGMVAIANLVPVDFLRNRSAVEQLVRTFDPLVRAIDNIVGEQVSMRVDLECSNGRHTVGIFSHKKLSVSVGVSTAAFALAMLEGNPQPGVWFPEEVEGLSVEARETLLQRASQGTFNFVMDRPPWMVESNPKEIGFGIYV